MTEETLVSWPRKCCLYIIHAVSKITDILDIRRQWNSFVGFLTCACFNKSVLSVSIQILAELRTLHFTESLTKYQKKFLIYFIFQNYTKY